MTRLLRLKRPRVRSLPSPVKILLNPMVIGAIALHALILFYPLSHEQKPKPKTDKKEEPVKLTQLSKAPQPQVRKRQVPKANINRPKPVVTTPPKPPAPGGGAQSKDILADFPHYPNAQPNCFGKTGDICHFTRDGIVAVASHFEKALPTKKFKAEPETNTNEEKIYKVTKGNQSFYLSILVDGSQTVYFVMSDRVDKSQLAKIKSGAVAQIPAELPALMDAVSPPPSGGGGATLDATPVDFGANASYFFESDPNNPSNQVTVSGVYSARIAEGRGEAEIVAQARARFTVTPAGTYGGGNLYELKKGSFTGYLSVVSGGSGAITVIWTQKP